jgi:hypothetical protein
MGRTGSGDVDQWRMGETVSRLIQVGCRAEGSSPSLDGEDDR